MDRLREVDILLLGKTGNGKSATGNFILSRKAFVSKSSSSSVTTQIGKEVSEYKGRLLKVVDGPGVGDTRMDNQEAVNLVMQAMGNAIALNDKGYHAFLLVVRFGGRFTKEDDDAVKLLKNIFGASFVKNYCILVMTHGDNFERESEDTGQTFEQWCEEQDGVLKNLYLECDKRVILFDNYTRDPEKKEAQLDRLLAMVDSLQFQGNRYSDEHFERAKDARERAAVQAKEPQIREETMTETSLILQKLDQIQKIEEPNNQSEPLKQLQTRADALLKRIKEQDKGTGALHELAETVESIVRTVQNEMGVCQRMIVEAQRRQEAEKKSKEEREMIERRFQEQQEQNRREAEREKQELQRRYEEIRRQEQQLAARHSDPCTIL